MGRNGGAVARTDHELFLLRIWAEPREISGAPSVYRGSIEHVRNARSMYLRALEQVPPFVISCIEDEGGLPPGGFVDEFGR
jgi:hypothetical protein